MDECRFKAVFTVEGFDKDLIIKSFKTLEREMRFGRGFVSVDVVGDAVVITACARDITSLRSLINGITKSLYLIFKAAGLGEVD